MKVAILGGSFDPVHDGHLQMAKKAYRQLQLDEVWFMPASDAPLKERTLTAYNHRIKMIEKTIEPYKHFKICRIEEHRSGKNYTIDTIRILKNQFPQHIFYFLMGADQVAQLDKWKEIESLEKEVNLCAFVRDGIEIKTKYKVLKLQMKDHPASSSKVRNGHFAYVNPYVRAYILEQGLYFDFVKTYMSTYRYEHSVRVAKLAMRIAKANALDTEKAYLCGILHDINKEFKWMSLEQSKKVIQHMRPTLLNFKEEIWHGYLGRFILEHELDFHDKKVLEAIENHVLGECRGIYAKLLYVADKLDPARDYDTEPLIKACCQNLNEGYKLVRINQKEFYGDENANGK